jgi:ribosome-binding protein aMBF1 (putative translation factor)
MKKGKLTIVGAIEDDTEDCSLCGKAKEGLVVQEEDGTELNWCWACAKKLMRMRRLAKAKADSGKSVVAAQNGS